MTTPPPCSRTRELNQAAALRVRLRLGDRIRRSSLYVQPVVRHEHIRDHSRAHQVLESTDFEYLRTAGTKNLPEIIAQCDVFRFCCGVLLHFRTASAVVPHCFRSGSSLLPQWFFTASAVVLHFFRSGSSLLPHYFRTAVLSVDNPPLVEDPETGDER